MEWPSLLPEIRLPVESLSCVVLSIGSCIWSVYGCVYSKRRVADTVQEMCGFVGEVFDDNVSTHSKLI